MGWRLSARFHQKSRVSGVKNSDLDRQTQIEQIQMRGLYSLYIYDHLYIFSCNRVPQLWSVHVEGQMCSPSCEFREPSSEHRADLQDLNNGV